MCGRLALHHLEAVRTLTDMLNIPPERVHMDGIVARYNFAPTLPVPVILEEGGQLSLLPMTWGILPLWALKQGKRSKRLINARSETAFELPSFRDAMKKHRCVVVANGFYEWHRDQNDRPLNAHYIRAAHDEWIAIAGIYQPAIESNALECCVLTTTPNGAMAPIHDRMPCLLSAEEIPAWLLAENKTVAANLLHPAPAEAIVEVPVSSRVNSIRNEGADLISPGPQHYPRQGDLLH